MRARSTNDQQSAAPTLDDNRGFSLLAVLMTMVAMGIALSMASRSSLLVQQREREADLLAKGLEIQHAISGYATRSKMGREQATALFPSTLEELTKQPHPLLRRVYTDPMTGKAFALVKSPQGQLIGVRSTSLLEPIRQTDWPEELQHFQGLTRYREWVFQAKASEGAPPQDHHDGSTSDASNFNFESAFE
jgi:type II secretory pathway pseudopilin PulG